MIYFMYGFWWFSKDGMQHGPYRSHEDAVKAFVAT